MTPKDMAALEVDKANGGVIKTTQTGAFWRVHGTKSRHIYLTTVSEKEAKAVFNTLWDQLLPPMAPPER